MIDGKIIPQDIIKSHQVKLIIDEGYYREWNCVICNTYIFCLDVQNPSYYFAYTNPKASYLSCDELLIINVLL